jgi:hypothetical protein
MGSVGGVAVAVGSPWHGRNQTVKGSELSATRRNEEDIESIVNTINRM